MDPSKFEFLIILEKQLQGVGKFLSYTANEATRMHAYWLEVEGKFLTTNLTYNKKISSSDYQILSLLFSKFNFLDSTNIQFEVFYCQMASEVREVKPDLELHLI